MKPNSTIPLPGQPVRGSRSGAPIMALLDLLGRRWALGILWVLAEQGDCGFIELQNRCETISPGVLSARLKELVEARFVVQSASYYGLTQHGRELFNRIEPLGLWAKNIWGPALTEHQPQ